MRFDHAAHLIPYHTITISASTFPYLDPRTAQSSICKHICKSPSSSILISEMRCRQIDDRSFEGYVPFGREAQDETCLFLHLRRVFFLLGHGIFMKAKGRGEHVWGKESFDYEASHIVLS